MAKCRCSVLIFITCLVFYLQYSLYKSIRFLHQEDVDVVYTWVNGSEERFLEQLHAANAKRGGAVKVDVNGEGRFAEKHELLYSLRSVEKHMPWIRHVYIVTNGQIPRWLNLHTGLVTIIPHESIFANRSHLPTFSSPAIEANLHRIPGISQRFIYFNDDWLIGAPVGYSTFYSKEDGQGQIFYCDFSLPNCSPQCPWSDVANGHCDVACYVPECQFDGADCPEPPVIESDSKESKRSTAFFASLQTTQRLLNENFGFRERFQIPHMPILIDKDVMQDAWNDFPQELSNTSSHHFRDAFDLQFEFFYTYFALEKKPVVSFAETLREYDANDDKILNDEEVDLLIAHSTSESKNRREFQSILEACTSKNNVSCNTCNSFNLTVLEECEVLGLYVEKTLGIRLQYKGILKSTVGIKHFYSLMALVSDIRKFLSDLRYVRRNRFKFICINDDLTRSSTTAHTDAEVYKELAEFYQYMFPEPSRYELPEGENNPPGKYIQELAVNLTFKRGGRRKEAIRFSYSVGWTYVVLQSLLVALTFTVCIYCRLQRRGNLITSKATKPTLPIYKQLDNYK